jgi:2,3-bisphosphoglycerate-dependent phosphoglycerate mutase
MSKLLFMRHGETELNAKDLFSGKQDNSPLNARGKSQAQIAGEKLKSSDIKIDRIVCSTLERAHETAVIIAKAIGVDPSQIEKDERLVEYDMGVLSGMPRTPLTSAQFTSTEGAENPMAFMKRVVEVLEELKQDTGTILIVAHSGVGRVIECYRKDLDPAGFYDLAPLPNATIQEL